MKKVILLGATSNISTYLIPHLLEQSDVELTLFARQATRRLGQYADNQRISLIDGNWNNPADLTAAIAGQEIVYLATGHFTKANQQVVTAMKQNGVAMKTVKIIVNGQTFTANFEENATASELLSQMPMTLPMLNLYPRELTYRFKQALPANEAHTSGYTVGDIAYWKPRHSFVIFYKQTGEVIGDLQQIGHINTSHLAQFQSLGNVEMRFEKEDLNS